MVYIQHLYLKLDGEVVHPQHTHLSGHPNQTLFLTLEYTEMSLHINMVKTMCMIILDGPTTRGVVLQTSLDSGHNS